MWGLTIITPTYNRAELLKDCYRSMCAQTDKRFEWIIVDDGSVDHTKDVVNSFLADKPDFTIKYYFKENGGKYTALNHAQPYIEYEFSMVLDSDDTLTDDAVETVLKDWGLYYKRDEIGILIYPRGHDANTPMAMKKLGERTFSKAATHANVPLEGDCIEAWRVDLVKRFPCPTFANEKHMPESVRFALIALECPDMLFVCVNKVICVCEYRDDGITRNVSQLVMSNPISALEVTRIQLSVRQTRLSLRLKKAGSYICYGLVLRKGLWELLSASGHVFLTICGIPIGIALFVKRRGYKYIKRGDIGNGAHE